MYTEKYFKTEVSRNNSWSKFGKQVRLVESLTLIWIYLLIVPSITIMYWIVEADPTQICLYQLNSTYNLQLPNFVRIIVFLINFWSVTGCTYLVLCSLTRQLIFCCIIGFWNSLGTRGESEYN